MGLELDCGWDCGLGIGDLDGDRLVIDFLLSNILGGLIVVSFFMADFCIDVGFVSGRGGLGDGGKIQEGNWGREE